MADEHRVEGEVVIDEAPPLKSPLIAVGDPNATPVKKANDAGNRSARVGGNVGAVSLILYFLNKYTTVNLDENDIFLALPFVTAAVSWIFNQLEYRGYIKSMKNRDAEIAPAVTMDGTKLGQAAS